MESVTLPQLYELQEMRKAPMILYSAPINNDAIRMVYECLRHMGPVQRLDLVLSTSGGEVTVARRLALLLREFTQHLTILVPYQARSAGTLLCLSANTLVLGPMAELGPIDAHIGSAGPPPPDAPGVISAEDIRTFRQMAEDWFGVNREKDRLQILALVAQRVFPTSLSSFYRADRLTRQAAHELLRYQLSDTGEDVRQQIVDQLVGGYNAHNHIITRVDAQALGLQVHFPSSREEALLWDLVKAMRRQYLKQPVQPGEEGIAGLIMSAGFCARQVQRWVDVPGIQSTGTLLEESALHSQKMPQFSWEIDGA
jgi:hypothetical protein